MHGRPREIVLRAGASENHSRPQETRCAPAGTALLPVSKRMPREKAKRPVQQRYLPVSCRAWWSPLPMFGGLLEGVGELQDAEVVAVTAHDLYSHRKIIFGKAGRY